MTIDTKALVHSEEFLTLCARVSENVREVSADEVERKLVAGERFRLIDVRDHDEFVAYRINGAEHLSKGWIEAKIHTLVHDPLEEIILYCGGGHRSLLAADNLQKMGYSNVSSMSGGIKGWVTSGKAVTR